MQEARVDTYYTRVEELLRDRKVRTEELRDSLDRLTYDLAHVVEGVVLRPFPLDMEIIPGHKDPQTKIENDIRQIHKERIWCNEEISRVVDEISEYQRLERLVCCLTKREGGPVIRGLYYEGRTWDALQEQLECARPTISYYRKRGIQTLADRMYIVTRNIQRVI